MFGQKVSSFLVDSLLVRSGRLKSFGFQQKPPETLDGWNHGFQVYRPPGDAK